MSELIALNPTKLKVKDVFNMNDLIKAANEWLRENSYFAYDDMDIDQHSQESLYTYKVTQGGAGLDVWIWWRVVKYPMATTKSTSFLRYVMNIDMHFLGDSGEVEVMHKGKKVKLNNGEIEFIITPFLELDYRNEWKKQGILKLVEKTFRKRMYQAEIDNHEHYFYTQLYKFQGVLKTFFGLEKFAAEEAVSFPPKGLL
jgi:hypothetical protein